MNGRIVRQKYITRNIFSQEVVNGTPLRFFNQNSIPVGHVSPRNKNLSME